jgi:Protein of unknown function (DUF2924)
MPLNLTHEVAALDRLGVADLRLRFAALFGEPTRAGNKTWLIKRLAWRLQALAEGDLSERARRRAAELAQDADLRLTPPRPGTAAARRSTVDPPPPPPRPHDPRLPPVGTVLTRVYKGRTLHVTILSHGFECDGTVYTSLSATAKAVTGSHCNGFLFFGLPGRGRQP